MRRLLLVSALTLAGLWLVAGLGLVLFARTLVYPFQPGTDASRPVGVPGARAAVLAAADGTPLTVWLVDPAPGAPVMLYFMGNGGALPGFAPVLAGLAAQGLGIAALNYRGAGGAPGRPSQAALTADALALYDGLDALLGQPVPMARRAVFGSSLGAALAVQLAARRPVSALVLAAPFNRLCEVAAFHYPIFPVCRVLPWERWDSAALIGTIAAPVLVMHGEADAVIPAAQGRRLFDAVRSEKRLVTWPGVGHNDIPATAAAAEAARFITDTTGR